MPTFAEWNQALELDRIVRLESTPALLAAVAAKQAQNDAYLTARGRPLPQRKPLTVVPQLAGERNYLLSPLFMLHKLGVITTPAVENLADICSTWAYLRYLWAFAIPSGAGHRPLALSEHAKNIDFHQKGLLSDQIGVGMAAAILERELGAPLAADVSVAMNDPAWPIDLQLSTSPDYLFFDTTHRQLFVVECKGTQSGRGAAIDQLRRGTEQVPSLVFSDGRGPPSIVIATQLSADGTCVLIIDPPSSADDVPTDGRSAKRVPGKEWLVQDSAQFARTARLISEAKILGYAGSDSAAVRKLSELGFDSSRLPRGNPRDTTVIDRSSGVFTGVRQSIPVRDRNLVEVFQGVERSLRDAYIAGNPAEISERLSAHISRMTSSGNVSARAADGLSIERTDNSITARSVSRDGTVLELRVVAR